MVIAITVGNSGWKPFVRIRMPYAMPRNKKPVMIGIVWGKAALSAGRQRFSFKEITSK